MRGGKLIVITAPSGAGKTTVVKYLLETIPSLAFSVSATTREKRVTETEGVDYYFLDAETFRQKIQNKEFIEWQQVYPNKFYGTLNSEISRLWGKGKHVIFDVDVKGALNLKKMFPKTSYTVFIQPPSLDVLIERLRNRNTESPQNLAIRIERIKMELSMANMFDAVIVNDKLEDTLLKAYELVTAFISEK